MDLILVVLYKQKIFESNTLLTLINCKSNLSYKCLFLWDNSPTQLESSEINFLKEKFINFKYLHSKENKSLSEVYNTVIKQIKFDKIFVFDQDSSITDEYFKLMDIEAENNLEIGLFMPFVKNNKRIVSPLFYKVVNFDHCENIKTGKTLAKNRTAFASGLCIKEWIFKKDNIWFDENLKFYGIDYKFTLDYGDLNQYMFVIDYQLEHSLSFTEEESKSIKIRRFDSNIAACFYLANARFNLMQKLVVIIRGFFSSFKMSLKYKDFVFSIVFFKNFSSFFIIKNFK